MLQEQSSDLILITRPDRFVSAYGFCLFKFFLSQHSKSNSIHGLGSIEVGNCTKLNTELCGVRFPNQSNLIEQIELNPSDCVGLRSETELNRTQLNGLRIQGTEESTLEVDSSVPLTPHDPADLGMICLVKKCKIRF